MGVPPWVCEHDPVPSWPFGIRYPDHENGEPEVNRIRFAAAFSAPSLLSSFANMKTDCVTGCTPGQIQID